MTDIAIVDDSNLERLSYTGPWQDGGKAPSEWNGTTHGSQTNGSQITFQFNGTQVEVYGTIGPHDSGVPISTYLLDSSPFLTYVAPTGSSTTYQNRFYQSPILPDGPHTLVITIISQDTLYWLDYLLYTPSSNTLSVCPVCTSSSPSSGALPSSNPHASKTSSPSSSQSFSVRALAGALVGGLILFALLAGGLYFFLKRRSTSTEKREASVLPDTQIPPSPTSAAHSSMIYLISSNNAAFTRDHLSTSLPARVSTTAHQQSISMNPVASSNGPSTQAQMPPSRHVEQETQLELQEECDLMPMDLPPAYQRDC